MSPRVNPPLPGNTFALLMVEGGDEVSLCEALLALAPNPNLVLWRAEGGADIPALSNLAAKDPNITGARSVSLLLDVEETVVKAEQLVLRALKHFDPAVVPVHATLWGTKQLGVYYLPEAGAIGSLETLCRKAARDSTAASCVDALQSCLGSRHTTQAQKDKSWLEAYLSTTPANPGTRLRQALSGTSKSGIDIGHAAFAGLSVFLASL